MKPQMVDRGAFLQNLRMSKLLTREQLRVVVRNVDQVKSSREIAKALVSWKLLTKYQAKMLLAGRNYGFFVGPYRIVDSLGRGGMGRVYKAIHQTMNRVVALKVLATQLVKTERAHQLFLREVQAAAQLNHPNIVIAYDANEAEGKHYLAMEFVDGPNLERFVRTKGSLPVGMACEIIFQAANGLQHAFERGMVHRDIKPANLLFHQEPGTGTLQVKILDFGLARLAQPSTKAVDGDASILTKQNIVMGTPDFLSPEQSRNMRDADIRSDLYSLGCTFYYLLTGQVPFPGGSIMDKLIRHASEIPQTLGELRPDIPAKVSVIVGKLLAKNPAERYQTPDELMEALAPYAAPSVMDWPVAPPPGQADDPTENDDGAMIDQVDTEPKAQSATQIGDQESIMEWADANRKQRRRFRLLLAAAVALAGFVSLGAGILLYSGVLNP